MSGWIEFGEPSYNQAFVKGRKRNQRCAVKLTIKIDDVDRFVKNPHHPARMTGTMRCDALGGELEVTGGSYNLFTRHGSPRHRRMLYRLYLRDANGRDLTLSGFKDVQHGPYLDDGWRDTSRLLTRILKGHLDYDPDGDELTVASGILHVTLASFARMILSMLWRGKLRGARAAIKFQRFFAGRIVRYYVRELFRPSNVNDANWPSATNLDPRWQGYEPDTWHSLPLAGRLERRIVGFRTEDGREGTLHNIRSRDRPPDRGPVMLAHGSSVRANLFYGAPTRTTIVRKLIDAGYDVWAENWRASIDLPASSWTLDEGAVYDHPAAVREILARTGSPTLKAVVHCQGSTSFMMSALAGLVPEVTHVVSNAVSLHVSITRLSHARLRTIVPASAPFFKGVDPQWTVRPPATLNAGLARVAALRCTCGSKVCKAANWFYGVGGEVLWLHSNLDQQTHIWNDREWGFCPLSFFKQMRRCADAGYLVSTGQLPQLPQDMPAAAATLLERKNVRFTFIAGEDNICFLPESQRRTHQFFEEIDPGRHTLHVIPGYSHLDIFIGKEADREVYPRILAGLE